MNSINTSGSSVLATSVLNIVNNNMNNSNNNSGADPVLNIDFQYSDCDSPANEIAELYSYTEENDFFVNRSAFEELMEDWGLPLAWPHHTAEQRSKALSRLAEGLEVSVRRIRIKCLRAVLYLVQGTFGDCLTLEEQERYARENVFSLYKCGMFPLVVQLLHLEVDPILQSPMTGSNNMSGSQQGSQSKSKSSIYMIDSADLRAILSVIYTFLEIMNSEKGPDGERLALRDQFKDELQTSMTSSGSEADGVLFAVLLFQMTMRFCNGSAPHFPIKKVLLVLWKVLLFTLGGSPFLREQKDASRSRVGLAPVPDDSLEVSRTMRPASPPASANDLVEAAQQRKVNRPFRRQSMIKQNAVATDEAVNNGSGGNGNNNGNSEDNDDETGDSAFASGEDKMDTAGTSSARPGSPRPSTPPPSRRADQDENENLDLPHFVKGLPWKPKVRQREVDTFLDQARSRFIGFVLSNDRITTAGLPDPIKESIRILQQHSYTSLAELQMKREDDLARYPLTMSELDDKTLDSPAERLYSEMLPHLPQYMIALLKILLAAAPTSKTKAESINILADLLPEEMPMSMLQSMKLSIDVNRHKEIIIKCVSAILLLLLKHYRLNHVYQFEYIAQQLMFANCIPLVLKFFNQNIFSYVTARNTISVIDFPACVIGEQPELSTEILEIGEQSPYCWRNMFSCINLLRVLNKLTKWKNSRVMMLVVFKSAPILKRALRVKNAMLQLYVLKLLKMQAKYLGRQWRKSNMKTMSAIYQKVRHRLTDDWAYGNDLDARPWDFQGEEFQLQAAINRFHARRYSWAPHNPGGTGAGLGGASPASAPPTGADPASALSGQFSASILPVGVFPGAGPTSADALFYSGTAISDMNPLSVLSKSVEITPFFKYNYQSWMEREVFNNQIDWDQLISVTDTTNM